MNKTKPGVWLLIFNVFVFVVACSLLFVIKHQPDYKIGLIIVIIGLIGINIHSMFRYWSYEKWIKNMKDVQNANIVPAYCPDYWSREDSGDTVLCRNKFEFKTDDEQVGTIRFGDSKTPDTYDLNTLSGLNNQKKCWNTVGSIDKVSNPTLSSAGMPWVDMQTKCSAAHI